MLWRNEAYIGAGNCGALIGDDGTVYLTGPMGPDLFAVDAEGNTLARIEQFGGEGDYNYSVDIRWEGDLIAVEDPETVYYVDPVDFSYSSAMDEDVE